jgi:hypothetical protein
VAWQYLWVAIKAEKPGLKLEILSSLCDRVMGDLQEFRFVNSCCSMFGCPGMYHPVRYASLPAFSNRFQKCYIQCVCKKRVLEHSFRKVLGYVCNLRFARYELTHNFWPLLLNLLLELIST